jgi:rhamnogalacturonyl hydrolase YesR
MKIRALVLSLIVTIAALVWTMPGEAQAPAYTAIAIDAEKWIRASRIETAAGVTWPPDPANPKSTSAALYSGSPGVVLFLLELHHATGRREYLDEAKRGADDLIGRVATEKGTGLYDGVAGLGFVLGETWRATKDDRYLKAA